MNLILEPQELWNVRFALHSLFRKAEYLFLIDWTKAPAFDLYFPEELRAHLGPWRLQYEAVLRSEWESYRKGKSRKDDSKVTKLLETQSPDKAVQKIREMGAKQPTLIELQRIDKEVAVELGKYPQGPDKVTALLRASLGADFGDAAQDYETAIWLSRHGERLFDLVARERQVWIEARERHKKQLTPWKSFWVGRDQDEEFYPYYHLHFARHFNISGFEDVWDEVYAGYGETLIMEPEYHPYLLHLLTTDPTILEPLASHLVFACDRLSRLQSREGYWVQPSLSGDRPSLPDTWFTACFALFILQFGGQKYSDTIDRSVAWLQTRQAADGAWYREFGPSATPEKDLVTTLIAAEVLHRTGVDPEKYAVGSAMNWVWSQQKPDGTFATVLTDVYPTEIGLHVLRTTETISSDASSNQLRPVKGSPTPQSLPRALILTALPVEFNAVVAHLSDLEEKEFQGTVYEKGILKSQGQSWEVWVTEIGMGNAAAAQEAERGITHIKPSVALFVGVAGGLKDVSLGDVIAATKIYGYESGKAKTSFEPRPDVAVSSHRLVHRARTEARKSGWLSRIQGGVSSPEPKVRVGPLAAGEKVVASRSSDTWKLLRSSYGDALAVEMEGRGFLQAAHSGQVLAMVVRGISDLVSNKSKSDGAGWQETASRHAAAFAFQILSKLT